MVVQMIKKAHPNMEVLAAYNAAKAIEIFEPGSFAIVITDVIMPGGMSGMDLTEHLLSLTKSSSS